MQDYCQPFGGGGHLLVTRSIAFSPTRSVAIASQNSQSIIHGIGFSVTIRKTYIQVTITVQMT